MFPSEHEQKSHRAAGGGEISIIVPVFNEESSLPRFFERLGAVLDWLDAAHEIICVNDGSSDGSLPWLLERQKIQPEIKIIDLSRNFGKESALSAGLDHCRGEAAIPIDADLQDPPELIPALLEKWREGYDIVYAVRKSRRADTHLKRLSAGWFYRIYNFLSDVTIPANAGDFRLLDRRVVEVLKRLPERNRFMKGLFTWVGFKQTGVEYQRESRAEGSTKWNYWRLWNFALDGITSFSTIPLRVWSYVGLAISLLAFLYASFIILRTLIVGVDIPGYASLMAVILFIGGIQLLGLGIMGEYLSRLFQETKQRPLYVVRQRYGLDPAPEENTSNGA